MLLIDIFYINWFCGVRVCVLLLSVMCGECGDLFGDVWIVIGDEEGWLIYLFSIDLLLCMMIGDVEVMVLYVGMGVGWIEVVEMVGDVL